MGGSQDAGATCQLLRQKLEGLQNASAGKCVSCEKLMAESTVQTSGKDQRGDPHTYFRKNTHTRIHACAHTTTTN